MGEQSEQMQDYSDEGGWSSDEFDEENPLLQFSEDAQVILFQFANILFLEF